MVPKNDPQIRVTKLERTDDGWKANVNGIPMITLGRSGTMSCWVTEPHRGNGRTTREVRPAVRAILVRKVRQMERREVAA